MTKAAVPTTAYVAREKIDAVPMISVQQTLIAAKIPKVAPAVSSEFICACGKSRGPIRSRTRPRIQ